MKQTAVEFLFNAVYRDMPYPELLGLIAQARIMEKQQIIDAHGIKTKSINQDQSEIITGSQYYNETFKKK